MAALFYWEFLEVNSQRKVWYREYPSFKSVDEAVEKYMDIISACPNCQGHRLMRSEKIGDTTIKTRMFFTLNSKPQEPNYASL
jgi:hypothetical protein